MAGMPTNVLDAGGLRVARCDFDGDFDAPAAHANARLIASAPDLLEALRAIDNLLDQEPFDLAIAGEIVHQAITKAVGLAP